tara:strand:- start:3499 stop:4677 length:1179 start_codon:yes stop_codon:yes gene_type:complete
MKNFNIVIIGAGLYVCGKGTNGFGTILPSIFEWKRNNIQSGDVYCVSTSVKSSKELLQKASDLETQTGVKINLKSYPKSGAKDKNAYKKLIKNLSKPACAIIAVPDHLHYKVAKDCLEAGLHVLLVKPFTPTYHEGLELKKLANKLSLYGAVEFHKRWDKSNLVLRDKFKSGELGTPLSCWIEYSQKKSIPLNFFKDWASKTSILQYLGVHYIDLIRFVTGAFPKKVMAIGQKSEIVKHNIETYDSIQCVIEWELSGGDRFTETLFTSWVDPESSSAVSDQKIKFIGTKGRYEADQKERGIRTVTDDLGIQHINPDFCMPYGSNTGSICWRGYGIESITTFLNDVISLEQDQVSLSELQTKRPSFEDALISTKVIESAHLSLRNNSNWEKIK